MTDLVALPGDHGVVDLHARRYLRTADAINDAARELITMVQGDGSVGEAFDALHDLAYEVSKNITKAEKRYRTATEALIDYADALRLAKDLANRSIQQAGPASADIAYWEAKVREYEDDAHRPGPDQATAQHKLQQAKYTLHEFTSHVHAATGSYERAVHDRDYAAEHAMKRIESVVAESKVNDSLLDDLKGFVSGILSSIVQLIKDIAETVVRLLAVVLIVLVAIALLAQLLLLLFGTGAMLLGLVIGSFGPDQRPSNTGEGSYGSLLDEQARIDGAGGDADGNGNGNSESAVVSVTRVVRPDGVVRWNVVIPSTQDWFSTGGTPNDFGADLVSQLSPSQRTQLMKAVTAVMTEGSPIAQYEIPSDISVLSIEHPGDLVPDSDFLESNPESSHQHTITSTAQSTIHDGNGNQAVGSDGKPIQPNSIGHGATDFRGPVRDHVDNGRDAATTRFVADTREFFSGSSQTNYYRATRG